MNRDELVRLLRDTYKCQACGAEPGQPCRTMRHHPGRPGPVGYATSPHQSRYDQYRRDRTRAAEAARPAADKRREIAQRLADAMREARTAGFTFDSDWDRWTFTADDDQDNRTERIDIDQAGTYGNEYFVRVWTSEELSEES